MLGSAILLSHVRAVVVLAVAVVVLVVVLIVLSIIFHIISFLKNVLFHSTLLRNILFHRCDSLEQSPERYNSLELSYSDPTH